MAKEIRGDSEELWYGTEWVGNSLFCFHGKKLGSKGKGCGEAALCSYLELLKVKVAQSCPTLWPGILQARKLEWVAFSLSRRSSQPRDQTQVSHMAGGFFTS